MFTVQGYVSTLLDGAMDDKNIRKKYLKRAEKGVERLIYIVEDLDMITKLESGDLDLNMTDFDIVVLIQNVFDLLEMKADKKKIKLAFESRNVKSVIVRGDQDRIQQVLENLIVNSIKYGKDGGLTEVGVVNLTKKKVLIRISDNGEGVEKQNIPRLFERFYRVDKSGTRSEGGSGLGLAIVKRLLELQGLQMHVNSKENEGSEFLFNMEFPVATEITPVERKIQSSNISTLTKNSSADSLENGSSAVTTPAYVTEPAEIFSMGLRVLIAEDNPVNVMLMKKLFSKWKIVPTIAENGERAVEIMQYGNFDIILMDLQMPVMNGFDAAIEIRKMPDPAKANIPIIALTASALFDIKDQVTNAGMNGYIAKPFKPDELMEKIQSLVATV